MAYIVHSCVQALTKKTTRGWGEGWERERRNKRRIDRCSTVNASHSHLQPVHPLSSSSRVLINLGGNVSYYHDIVVEIMQLRMPIPTV